MKERSEIIEEFGCCSTPDLSCEDCQDCLNEGENRILLKVDKEAVADVIRKMAERIIKLEEVISEVHSWAVCGCITSPEDMAQNFEHIVEITKPDCKEN